MEIEVKGQKENAGDIQKALESKLINSMKENHGREIKALNFKITKQS